MDSTPKRPRFLVLRGGAIGDFVLTLPALRALRERWPDAHIELLGYPHVANLALACGLVDHVDSLDRAGMARFFSLIPSFSEEQIEYIRSFDLIVSFLHDPGGVVQENLRAAGARQVIYGSPLVERGHAVDHLVKPLETLALYVSGENPRLEITATIRKQGASWLAARGLETNAVAIHPGSGSPKKNWPVDRFAELARKLAAGGIAGPFFTWGEADEKTAGTLQLTAGDIPFLTNCTLVELAAVFANCRAYVGNDSGITHIAAALGIPVVALFGPSDPDRWGPRGPNVKILRAQSRKMKDIELSEVLAALM